MLYKAQKKCHIGGVSLCIGDAVDPKTIAPGKAESFEKMGLIKRARKPRKLQPMRSAPSESETTHEHDLFL